MRKYIAMFVFLVAATWQFSGIAADLSTFQKNSIIVATGVKAANGQVMLIGTNGKTVAALPEGDYKSSKNTIRVKNGTVMLIGTNGMTSALVDGTYISSSGNKIVVQNRQITSAELMAK